jgi:hypothetical protein
MSIRSVTVFLLDRIDIHLEVSRVSYEKNEVGNAANVIVGAGVSSGVEIGEDDCRFGGQ